MNSTRVERLQKKYGNMQVKAGQKEMNIGRMANRGRALSMSGCEKNGIPPAAVFGWREEASFCCACQCAALYRRHACHFLYAAPHY